MPVDQTPETCSQIFKRVGESIGLSDEAFAEAIGRSRQTIYNYRNGITAPREADLLKMLATYSPEDWRYKLANDCLQALVPEWREVRASLTLEATLR
jgi:transcriptional regulator with XRE-family HTH domain